jgi:hypothetical protein
MRNRSWIVRWPEWQLAGNVLNLQHITEIRARRAQKPEETPFFASRKLKAQIGGCPVSGDLKHPSLPAQKLGTF